MTNSPTSKRLPRMMNLTSAYSSAGRISNRDDGFQRSSRQCVVSENASRTAHPQRSIHCETLGLRDDIPASQHYRICTHSGSPAAGGPRRGTSIAGRYRPTHRDSGPSIVRGHMRRRPHFPKSCRPGYARGVSSAQAWIQAPSGNAALGHIRVRRRSASRHRRGGDIDS